MDAENLASLIIAAVSFVLVIVLFLLFRVFDNPLKSWYGKLVEKSHAIGSTHPIDLFKPLDLVFTLIYEGILFGLTYIWGLGFLPCVIVCSLFLFYRVLFYRQLITSAFFLIFKDKQEGKGDKTLDTLSLVFLIIGVILIMVPILNLIAKAFSNGNYNSQVTFAPVGFTFYSFGYVFKDSTFWKCFGNSVLETVVVTVASNVFMGAAGYCLSKPDFPFRNFLITFFVITMLFSAGIIPIYLLMSWMHLLNTIWSVILISINNVYNLLLYKTTFESVPKEIEESAQVDGCNSLQLFFRIMIPMIVPTVASCCFFSVVGCWNGYGAALMFITDNDNAPLSLYIYRLLSNSATNTQDPVLLTNYQNIQAASIIISVIPILIIYPYIIRYIKSGLTLGSVKG